MPRGKLLSGEEVGKVKAYHSEGKSNRWIAKTLGRSEKAVRTCLASKRVPRVKKKAGRHAVLKKIDVRRASRLAVHDCLPSRAIANLLPKKPHYTTVIKALHNTRNAKYVKRKPQPTMKQHHKKKRRAYAVHHLNRSDLWRSVLFTDEKKFNLDGPDDYRYYWHDLRTEPQVYSRRVSGGGSLMVWAAISYYNKSDIVFLDGRQNAAKYIKTLRQTALPFMENLRRDGHMNGIVFQHDNASIHTARC